MSQLFAMDLYLPPFENPFLLYHSWLGLFPIPRCVISLPSPPSVLEDYHLPSRAGSQFLSPQHRMMSCLPRLLCFTGNSSQVSLLPSRPPPGLLTYQVAAGIGHDVSLLSARLLLLALIHITHTGFEGRIPDGHTSSRRSGPGLGPLESQAPGFTVFGQEKEIS